MIMMILCLMWFFFNHDDVVMKIYIVMLLISMSFITKEETSTRDIPSRPSLWVLERGGNLAASVQLVGIRILITELIIIIVIVDSITSLSWVTCLCHLLVTW